MKAFLKRHVTGILALFLGAVIAVLSFAVTRGATVYSSTLTEEDLPPVHDKTNAPAEDPKTDPKDEIDYARDFPRAASPSDEYLYFQKAYGKGNIVLKEAHQTPVGLYVVAETDCAEGDLEGAKPTVGVLKFDSSGNLDKTFSLSANVAVSYVASQFTPLGLCIVTAGNNQNFCYVNLVSYELDGVKTNLVSFADEGKIYATSNGFLLFTNGEKGSVLYEYSEKNYRFFSLPSAEPVAIFEYGDFFSFFYNTAGGYAHCEIQKKTFSVKKERTVSGGKLLAVYPVESDGQKLIAIVEDGELFFKKYQPHTLEELDSQRVGSYKVLGSEADEKNVYLAVQGAVNGIVVADGDLTTSFFLTDVGFLPTVIFDSLYRDDAFYLLAGNGEKTALVKTTNEGSSCIFLPATKTARLCPNQNGTFSVVTDAENRSFHEINLFGLPG